MSYADYMDQNPTSMQPKAVGGGFWGFLGRGAAAKYGREKWMYENNAAERGIARGIGDFVADGVYGLYTLAMMETDSMFPTPQSMNDFSARGGMLINGVKALSQRIDGMFLLSAQYKAQMQLGDDLWHGTPSDYTRDSAAEASLRMQAGANLSDAWSMFRVQPAVQQWEQGTYAALAVGSVVVPAAASRLGMFGGAVEAVPFERQFKAVGSSTRRYYVKSPKHSFKVKGNINPAPINGQDALDTSTLIKDTSPRRVGVDHQTGDYVVFDRTIRNEYHGHTRTWDQLTSEMQNALVESGMANRRGKLIG